jgi:hypothetical protein
MTNPASDPLNELRQLWLEAPGSAPPVDPRALERAARRLRRRVWVRNLSEWSAAVVLVPLTLDGVLHGTRLGIRLGLCAIILAAIYVSTQLYRRGRLGKQPPSASTAEFLQHHLQTLRRQAELLESVWRWYLLPFVPGITLIYVDAARGALARADGAASARIWLTMIGSWFFTGLIFIGIDMLNRRAAARLRREMAALGAP